MVLSEAEGFLKMARADLAPLWRVQIRLSSARLPGDFGCNRLPKRA